LGVRTWLWVGKNTGPDGLEAVEVVAGSLDSILWKIPVPHAPSPPCPAVHSGSSPSPLSL